MENIQKRGQLTKRIKIKSKELLGYEITQEELRLFPYIMYVVQNEKRIDIYKINERENEIIYKWKEAEYIKDFIPKKEFWEISITKEFWNILSEIIFLGYVDLSE